MQFLADALFLRIYRFIISVIVAKVPVNDPRNSPSSKRFHSFKGTPSLQNKLLPLIKLNCELSFSLLLLDRTALPLGKASIIRISTLPAFDHDLLLIVAEVTVEYSDHAQAHGRVHGSQLRSWLSKTETRVYDKYLIFLTKCFLNNLYSTEQTHCISSTVGSALHTPEGIDDERCRPGLVRASL